MANPQGCGGSTRRSSLNEDQEFKGSEKIQITQFGENAFSISTVLGNAVIQYTK